MVHHTKKFGLALVFTKFYWSNIFITTNKIFINRPIKKLFNYPQETSKDGCNVAGGELLYFVI